MEIDTTIGKGHEGVLVAIVECSIQKLLYACRSKQNGSAVTEATNKTATAVRKNVHAITDNDKDFFGYERIARALDTKVYFAHPYSSWQRKLNANTNGLLSKEH